MTPRILPTERRRISTAPTPPSVKRNFLQIFRLAIHLAAGSTASARIHPNRKGSITGTAYFMIRNTPATTPTVMPAFFHLIFRSPYLILYLFSILTVISRIYAGSLPIMKSPPVVMNHSYGQRIECRTC